MSSVLFFIKLLFSLPNMIKASQFLLLRSSSSSLFVFNRSFSTIIKKGDRVGVKFKAFDATTGKQEVNIYRKKEINENDN